MNYPVFIIVMLKYSFAFINISKMKKAIMNYLCISNYMQYNIYKLPVTSHYNIYL